MCTAAIQENLPDFLTNTSNTKVVLPGGIERRGKDYKEPGAPRGAVDVPLGSGLADAAKLSLMNQRKRIDRAVEGE